MLDCSGADAVQVLRGVFNHVGRSCTPIACRSGLQMPDWRYQFTKPVDISRDWAHAHRRAECVWGIDFYAQAKAEFQNSLSVRCMFRDSGSFEWALLFKTWNDHLSLKAPENSRLIGCNLEIFSWIKFENKGDC